jgi:hypothetical protein
MQNLILATTATLLALSFAAPIHAAVTAEPAINAAAQTQVDKRSNPRVPGGSGCDSVLDVIQHPQCR